MQKPVLLPHPTPDYAGKSCQLTPDQLEHIRNELQADMLGSKALLEHFSADGKVDLGMAYSVLALREARLADLCKLLGLELDTRVPDESVARFPNLAGVIPNAIRGYLRRCSSGGMSKKQIDVVQANVDEAERLGYFKLAIAEAVLAARKR